MTLALPASPEALAKASWNEIRPHFDALAARPLDAGSMEQWLADWSRLEAMLTEAASRAMIRYTVDTRNKEAEEDHLRFSTEILPQAEERSVALQKLLVASGHTSPALETTLRAFRTSIEIFRDANVPIMSELEEHSATYQRITGGMTAPWEGKHLPLPRLAPFLKELDRDVRERAFRASTMPYMDSHDELAVLFDRMRGLRQQVAHNAGFDSFRDYVFRAKLRFDYTPADCERFHEAVERHVMPAYARLMAHRRDQLRLSALRPWDLAVDLYGAKPLRPFTDGTELAARARAVFDQVDPTLGARVRCHDRREAARPGQPGREGARRLLRHAALAAGGPSSS